MHRTRRKANITKKRQASACRFFGLPERIRTADTKRRRLVLYPAELRVVILIDLSIIPSFTSVVNTEGVKKYKFFANTPSAFAKSLTFPFAYCIITK